MISMARNTGSCLGPKKNSGIKKNTMCASEHKASSNQFAPGEIDPKLNTLVSSVKKLKKHELQNDYILHFQIT